MVRTLICFIATVIISDSSRLFLSLRPGFPTGTGEDEDDVKYVRSHRMKMEISGHFLGTR